MVRSALRSDGAERKRSLLFVCALVLGLFGSLRWLSGAPTVLGANPLSFNLTLSTLLIGVAVLRYGLPGVTPPASDGSGTAPVSVKAADPQLSPRQLEIMDLVVKGYPYRKIAERLGITERAVKYHLPVIMDKCGVRNRAQLIALFAGRKAGAATYLSGRVDERPRGP